MRKMKAPILTDRALIETIRHLYFSEGKPTQITPVDISILTYLILRRSEDHEIFDSQETIAGRIGCERKTVGESLERLKRMEWISIGGRGQGRTKAIAIRTDKLPASHGVRAAITQQAKSLTVRYHWYLKRTDPRRRFRKDWLQRQLPSAQRILTLCGGDLDLARAHLNFAMRHPIYKRRAETSLYHAICIWGKISRAYVEALEKASPAPNRDMPTEGVIVNADECNPAA